MSYKQWWEAQREAEGIEAVPVFSEEVWNGAISQSAAEIAALRAEVERLKAENEKLERARSMLWG